MNDTAATPPRPDSVVPFPRLAQERIEMDAETLQHLTRLFERSARRWEIVVYPSLLAFVVLAFYGFYLIYSLTSDVHRIAQALDPHMGAHMQQMTASMQQMTANTATMPEILKKMDTMDQTMRGMGHGVQAMAYSNQQMNHSMATMTHAVARPMSMMNLFMPW